MFVKNRVPDARTRVRPDPKDGRSTAGIHGSHSTQATVARNPTQTEAHGDDYTNERREVTAHTRVIALFLSFGLPLVRTCGAQTRHVAWSALCVGRGDLCLAAPRSCRKHHEGTMLANVTSQTLNPAWDLAGPPTWGLCAVCHVSASPLYIAYIVATAFRL